MKISTKGRYGLEALLDMAIYGDNDYISLKSISERQGISDNYLEQLFVSLKKSGIVDSLRGVQGGYRLAVSPDKLSIKRILTALEGQLLVVDEDRSELSNVVKSCIRRNVWDRMSLSIDEVVDSITLGDLVEDFKKISGSSSGVYYI